MITRLAFIMHRPCVAKELAVGFSTDQNSRPGLIRQAQSTSGVTEFLVVEKLFCWDILSII
ncbi:hypothetical protein GQ44DRAFT_703952 [Phaeosphaeriaceae sp. PMI808]|nr:hypothetical protein GQ44DRAFT_703952 [Phaeosphaeriaceae sp. PMI808]